MKEKSLNKDDFSFELPDELIAHKPTTERTASRLLVSKRARSITSSHFAKIGEFLPRGSLLIRNNSKVIPSLLFGQTSHGGALQVNLLRPVTDSDRCRWLAIGKPFRKLRVGSSIFFGETKALVEAHMPGEPPQIILAFDLPWKNFDKWLDSFGAMPIPPYIDRKIAEDHHSERYQTVYAGPKGSAAAPTAGLHFSTELIETLQRDCSIEFADVTLHVGAGTFLPVKSKDIENHSMHAESYQIPEKTVDMIEQAKKDGRKIFAVGSTAFRSVESFYLKAAPRSGNWYETDLFIYPKNSGDTYSCKIFDGMITNFHLPESTLIMLVAALAGYRRTMEIYQFAIKEKMRFFSYGDSSFIEF